MDARKDLYAFAMKGEEHSPDISEMASERIDAYRAAVLCEAAKALERRFGMGPTTVELRLMAAKAQVGAQVADGPGYEETLAAFG